jgi:transposase-like protein
MLRQTQHHYTNEHIIELTVTTGTIQPFLHSCSAPYLMEGLIPRKGGVMPAPRKYPEELRQRAIRLVAEAREQEPDLSLNAAVHRIGPRVGVNPDTLRTWCKQAEIDSGRRPGVTTSDAAEIKALRQEVKELKRANEILLAASSFFARELDPRLPW